MVAEGGDIVHLDLGDRPPDVLIQLQPELTGIRLGFGIRGPVIGDMLILAGDLTAVTAITDTDIMDKDLLFLIVYTHLSYPHELILFLFG